MASPVNMSLENTIKFQGRALHVSSWHQSITAIHRQSARRSTRSTETKCIQELTPVLTLWGNKKEFHIRYLDFASHSPFTAPFAKSWLPNSNFPLTHKSYQCVRLLRSSMRTYGRTDMGAHRVALQFYWTRLKTETSNRVRFTNSHTFFEFKFRPYQLCISLNLKYLQRILT